MTGSHVEPRSHVHSNQRAPGARGMRPGPEDPAAEQRERVSYWQLVMGVAGLPELRASRWYLGQPVRGMRGLSTMKE